MRFEGFVANLGHLNVPEIYLDISPCDLRVTARDVMDANYINITKLAQESCQHLSCQQAGIPFDADDSSWVFGRHGVLLVVAFIGW